jgi:molybdopterin-guanine dinucleotide biosynthesis protein B
VVRDGDSFTEREPRRSRVPPIVAFIGRHNSGKTTLIRAVTAHLRAGGYRVAVIKSTKHSRLEVHRPGSDSALLRADGVPDVALVGPEEMILWQEPSEEPLVHLAFRLFPDADLIICEGFKHTPGIPKIEVVRAAVSQELLRDTVPGVTAVVADFPVAARPTFRPDQAEEIAIFIKEEYLALSSKEDVLLFVNQQAIPLNRYVRKSLLGTLSGFVSALKGTEEAEELEIRIRRPSTSLP